MKKLFALILAAAMLLSLCACAGNNAEPTETTQPKVQMDATDADIAKLESLYEGRTAYHGDTHAHSASSEHSDGKHGFDEWRTHMQENQIDFATIVDHSQTLHMSHKLWDDTLFIGGSEPGMYITGTEYTSKNNIDYAMLFTDLEQFEAYLNTYPLQYQLFNGIFQSNFHASHAQIAEMIQSIKDQGGMFTYVHPMGKEDYYDPVDMMNYWFADETCFEVSNQIFGDFNSEDNIQAYDVWVYLLNNGKRLWATSGSDAHATLPRPYILSTVYATEKTAESCFAQIKTGNLTAGPVGIRTAVGDTATGGKCSFAGQRVVMAVGDFHELAVDPDHTYRLDIYDETGLIASSELDITQMNYFAFDAREDALYYRADVYDVTGGIRFAVGNPVFNG